jgi:hypothetical protein
VNLSREGGRRGSDWLDTNLLDQAKDNPIINFHSAATNNSRDGKLPRKLGLKSQLLRSYDPMKHPSGVKKFD